MSGTNKNIPEQSTPLSPAVYIPGFDSIRGEFDRPCLKDDIQNGGKLAGINVGLEGRVADGRDDELISAGLDTGEEKGAVVMGSGSFGGAVQKNTDGGNGHTGCGVPYRS